MYFFINTYIYTHVWFESIWLLASVLTFTTKRLARWLSDRLLRGVAQVRAESEQIVWPTGSYCGFG